MGKKRDFEPMEPSADGPPPVRAMRDRVYEDIPVDAVVVVNSRNRDPKQFADNVRSIASVGLYKPIIVNRRVFERTGKYELICGEGRLLAHKELGKDTIRAEVVDFPETTAQLMTLAENIARNPPAAIEFARALKQMRDDGMTTRELAQISGRSESHITKLLALLDKGENRLVKGVEDGLLPLEFAYVVAESDSRSIQHLLIDAFDSGLVNSGNVVAVRTVIEDRMRDAEQAAANASASGNVPSPEDWTVGQLRKEITTVTNQKERFVHQASIRMNRVMALLAVLNDLSGKPEYMALAEKAGRHRLPSLAGDYNL